MISTLKIHISSETAMALQSFEGFNVELRGELDKKVGESNTQSWRSVLTLQGKGVLTTYWLIGEQ